MPEIEITGDGTARGIWAMFDYVEWDQRRSGPRVGLEGYGHYREEYKKARTASGALPAHAWNVSGSTGSVGR